MNADNTPTGRDQLLIEQLTISRLDGINREFTLDGLTAGINLVHGPNASGKSRTATALQALLWPRIAPPNAELTGRLVSNTTHWAVTVDERGARHMRDQAHVDPPALSGIPADQRDRYLLTLHDLLQSDNRSLAEQIQRESAGGYDLNRARIDAGVPKALPKPGGRREMLDLQTARHARIALQRHDADLQRQEQSLHRILEQISEASAARHRVGLIDRALEHAAAVEALAARQEERRVFNDPIGSMTGRELDDVQERQAKLAELDRERETIEERIVEAQRQRDECGFPDEIPSQEVIEELRQRHASLRELMDELARYDDAISIASAAEARRRAAIGDTLTSEQLETLDANGLLQLAELTREFVRLDGEQDAQESLAAWIGDVQAPANLPELRKGVELLTDRLRYIGTESDITPTLTVKLALLLAAGIVVLSAVVLAMDVAPYWAVLALLALPLVWVAFRREPSGNAGEVARLEREFDALGSIPHPAGWDEAAISRTLQELRISLQQAEVDDEKAKRWADLENRRQRVSEMAASVAARRETLRHELGIVPAVDGDWDALRRIGENLAELRRLVEDVAIARDQFRHTEEKIEAELEQVNRVLGAAGSDPVADSFSLGPRIDTLQQRIQQAETAETRIAILRQEIAGRIEPEQQRLRSAISMIYADLHLDHGDALALQALCDQVPGCQEAEQRVREARSLVESARLHLAPEPELATLDREALDRLRAEVETVANRHEDLVRQHSAIRTKVEEAKNQTRIEEASAKEHDAMLALEEARDESYAKSAAWHFAEFVHERTRDLNRPPVYREAQDLFAAFTSGAFTLEFGDSTQPVFMARESASGEVVPLDKLSSGTRVQLLMAVRMAFIEMLEHGYRLPLLLDETLGNTDDTRISAIMDATIEISRRGRQIIYFTAQHEEIAKWQARLESVATPLPYRVFDLEDIRGLAGASAQSVVSVTYTPVIEPAVPAHLNHADARQFFQVAPVDPWAATLDGAHLWYFITDVPVLARFHELGVDHWGQYCVLRDRRALEPLFPDLDTFDTRAALRHRTLAAALELWRIGRSRPIDRNMIIKARVFYSKTVDDICALGDRCAWDGPVMLAALQDGEVDGVTQGRIERFEEFLRETDRMVLVEPYTPQMIRAQVVATMQGELDEAEIDEILQTLG